MRKCTLTDFYFHVDAIYKLWTVVTGSCCLFIYFIIAIICLVITILRCKRHITGMIRP